MPLDIAILGSNGVPLDFVALHEDVHWELVTAAQVVGCEVFLRLSDIYGEVEFAHPELQSLLDGLDAMVPDLRSPAREVADDLRQLVGKAMLTNQNVHALPD